MSDALLSITRDGDVATLTIAAPPLNLLTAELTEQLDVAIGELEAAPPRALLVRADGRVWTGGVDVEQFAGRSAQGGHDLWVRLLGFTQRLEALPCPSVFSAHALCLTWGLELALGCDLLIASPKAKFGLVEKVVGLTPSMGGTQRLAARAGNARAKAFVFSGGLYGAEELYQWGVVTHLVPEEELEAAARARSPRSSPPDRPSRTMRRAPSWPPRPAAESPRPMRSCRPSAATSSPPRTSRTRCARSSTSARGRPRSPAARAVHDLVITVASRRSEDRRHHPPPPVSSR